MTNKKDDEKEKIQGRLTVVQSLWDYERTQILKALGIAGDINPRSWATEALVDEIKDCIDGHKMLVGEGDPNPLYRDNIVKLDDGDPELERAWQTFPDPDADCHGYTGVPGDRTDSRAVDSCFYPRVAPSRIAPGVCAGTGQARMESVIQTPPEDPSSL